MTTSPRQAVILAAGASTRTYPLTIGHPKPLLPLLNKPILQHTLEQLDGLVEQVTLVVGYEREQIKAAFGSRFNDIQLDYCVQEAQLGTGHALLQARPYVRGSFFHLNGDDLVHRHDLERMAVFPCAALGQWIPDPSPYGILQLDKRGLVRRIIEKPTEWEGEPLVNTGMYVFPKTVFEALDALGESCRGEYELTDVVEIMTRDNVPCTPVKVSEYWLPVGYPWKLLETNQFLLARCRPATPVIKDVKIQGPVLIGQQCTLDPGCELGAGTTLGNNCHLGAGSSLHNCILMDDVQIGPDCHLRDTIVAQGARLAANVLAGARNDDGSNIYSAVKGTKLDTGRASLGAVIGAGVQIGANCRLEPGVKLWPQIQIPANSVIESDWMDSHSSSPGKLDL